MSTRRFEVPFDPLHFQRRALAGEVMSPAMVFAEVHAQNFWNGTASRSGQGSDGSQTERIRRELPRLCRALGVRRLLDIPCGDASWIAHVDLTGISYVGADIVPQVVAGARAANRDPAREFQILDLLASPLPATDLVLCRDCLVHLSFADIGRAIANVKRSGATWLLTTTFPDEATNEDIVTGDWRPLNLEAPPFAWPLPTELINEGCTEGGGRFPDKSLGLWRVADLPDRSDAA